MHRLGLARDGLDEPVGHPVGVAVQHPHPVHLLQRAHRVDQLRQAAFAVKVLAVAGGILRHQIQLGHARFRQTAALLQDILHGAAAEPPPNERNGAIAAAVVAALRHLDVGKPRLVGQDPLPFHRKALFLSVFYKVIALYSFPDGLPDPAVAAQTQHHVHLRDLRSQLGAVALRQTAGHGHAFQAALALGGAAFQNGIDGFLFGVLDKAAGIHDDRVAFGHIAADLISLAGQHSQQALGVHLVLAAPQRDHSHLNRHGTFPPAAPAAAPPESA